MFRAAMILTAGMFVASCADAGSSMDPSLTKDYCVILKESQFKSSRAGKTGFVGKIGGISVQAFYINDEDNVSMPKRGIFNVPKGTVMSIGEGDKKTFVRARKNTLIARGEGGPICGPVS